MVGGGAGSCTGAGAFVVVAPWHAWSTLHSLLEQRVSPDRVVRQGTIAVRGCSSGRSSRTTFFVVGAEGFT